MPQLQRYPKRQAKARQRHFQKTRECLHRKQRRAQRYVELLEQALRDLGVPETRAEELQGRLRAQEQLRGKSCGLMFSPTFWVPHGI